MGYVVATSPRCGSWLLCELLENTGVAGHPGEYGGAAEVATWRDHYGCASHAEYFFRFPALLRTPNGVLGTKLMWPQWTCLGADARRYLGRAADAYTLLDSLAGPVRVLRLRRADAVRQAVSLARAQHGGRWSRRAGEDAEDDPGRYDADAVRSAHAVLAWQNTEWDRELARIGAPVLELEYESMVADLPGTLRNVLRFLELEAAAPFSAPKLRRQADERSEEWVARARLDLAQ